MQMDMQQSSAALVNAITHRLFDAVDVVEVLAEAVELEVETQANVDYALQVATDLVSSNWTDSGYVLTGDGNPLRVYDPDAVEGSKSYRMRTK